MENTTDNWFDKYGKALADVLATGGSNAVFDAALDDPDKRAALVPIVRDAWRTASSYGVRMGKGNAQDLAYAVVTDCNYTGEEETIEALADLIDSVRLQAAKERKRAATREAMRRRRADRSSAH